MNKPNIQTTKQVVPMLYGYSTPEVVRHNGWTKIGYTEQDVETRINQQTHTADIRWQLEWKGNATFDDGSGETFIDKDFHAYLRKSGIEQEKGKNNEWFHVDGATSKQMFRDFREDHGILKTTDAVIPYKLREEQQRAVRVISQNELSNYKDKQIGYADYQYYGKFMQRLEDKNTGDPQVLHYLPILKKEYISDNPYVTLNIALLILNKLSQENWSDDGKKMIFAEGATVVAYALLDICRDVFGMSQELREKYISTKLTYGDSEATYINGLIESVTRYANEMLAEKIPKEYYNKNLVERMEIPAPHYTKNCIAIIERAYNNPEWYIDMLRNIDFILFEFMLKNQKFDYTLFSEHCKNYLVNEKLKACKNVLFFICSSAAVHLGDIWKEENDFVPQKIHNIEN